MIAYQFWNTLNIEIRRHAKYEDRDKDTLEGKRQKDESQGGTDAVEFMVQQELHIGSLGMAHPSADSSAVNGASVQSMLATLDWACWCISQQWRKAKIWYKDLKRVLKTMKSVYPSHCLCFSCCILLSLMFFNRSCVNWLAFGSQLLPVMASWDFGELRVSISGVGENPLFAHYRNRNVYRFAGL